MPTNLSSQFAQTWQHLARSGRLSWLALFLTVLWLAIALIPGTQAAAPPLAVDLLYFRGEGADGAALLEWETGTEADTAGFRLERASSAGGPFAPLDDIGLIPARGGVSSGAQYEATDETASNGQTYWYKLVELSLDNSTTGEWTTRVEVAPEATAQIIGGGGPTNTPTPTRTTAPTATTAAAGGDNSATATPNESTRATATATEAARATNTPRPTSTRQQAPLNPTRSSGGDDSFAPRTAAATATRLGAQDGSGAATVTATPEEIAAMGSVGEPTPLATVAANAAGEAGGSLAVPAAEAAPADPAAPAGGRVIGAGDRGEPGEGDADGPFQAEEESSSLLLWLGFLAAFFIFVGGIIFSIYLSTRKRKNNL